jgi:hypothetical protein
VDIMTETPESGSDQSQIRQVEIRWRSCARNDIGFVSRIVVPRIAGFGLSQADRVRV